VRFELGVIAIAAVAVDEAVEKVRVLVVVLEEAVVEEALLVLDVWDLVAMLAENELLEKLELVVGAVEDVELANGSWASYSRTRLLPRSATQTFPNWSKAMP